MSMGKVKVALLGIGGYARIYVNYMLDKIDPDQVQLVAAADPNPEGCLRLNELKCPIYADAAELFAKEQVDLTVISTPIHLHTAHICMALNAGSHVLCEKPLCSDPADIATIINAREKAGKFVMIGYQWSYNPAILKLKQDILDGIYGKPLSMKALAFMGRDYAYFTRNSWAGKRRTPSGHPVHDSIANNAAAHYLHNLLFLCGESLETTAKAQSIRAKLYRANHIETFDTVVANAICGDDISITYVASHCTCIQKKVAFQLEFSGGKVIYDGEQITGENHAGTTVYGNPDLNGYRKIQLAIENVTAAAPFIPCGVEAAGMQVDFVKHLNQLPIETFEDSRLRAKADTPGIWVEGLDRQLEEIFAK